MHISTETLASAASPLLSSTRMTGSILLQEAHRTSGKDAETKSASQPSAERQPLAYIAANLLLPTSQQPASFATAGPCPIAMSQAQKQPTRRVSIDSSAPGKLPGFVRKLQQHSLAPGAISVDDLQWELVDYQGQFSLAAAIPEDRLPDFIAGESKRGFTNLTLLANRTATDSTPLDAEATCWFRTTKFRSERMLQTLMAAGPPEQGSPGEALWLRRVNACTGGGCGDNCRYAFQAKMHAKAPGVVVLKFECEMWDTPETCRAMRHLSLIGEEAHSELEAPQVTPATAADIQSDIETARSHERPFYLGAAHPALPCYLSARPSHLWPGRAGCG